MVLPCYTPSIHVYSGYILVRFWSIMCLDLPHPGSVLTVFSAYYHPIRNVGFLRYWTVSQLPNFALAMPILLASIYGAYRFCISHYRRMAAAAQATLPKPPRSLLVEKCNRAIWNNVNVIPYMLIHVTTTYLLIFASHTQIALRMAMTNPIVFWTVAGLMGGKHQIWIGRWVTWSLSWGAISLVLWASFLPPA